MIRRHELTAKQFAAIADLLPARGKRGGRRNDRRTTLHNIFWWLYTGAQWREAPRRYGKAKSLYEHFLLWRGDGTLDKILDRWHLAPQRGRATGHSALVRGRHQHPRQPLGGGCGEGEKKKRRKPAHDSAVQALGRSRGGWGTQVHLVVDGKGTPLAASISAGQAHQSKRMTATLEQVCLRGGKGHSHTRPKKLAGDKGYS